MRRLPLLLLGAMAVLLIMRGGYYPPTGFEGVVYNAAISGDTLFSLCGLSAERRWAVMFENGTVAVVKPGATLYVNGTVKVAEVYATSVSPTPSALNWPLYHIQRCGNTAYNYVELFVGVTGRSLPYSASTSYNGLLAGRPICDPSRGYDSVCGQCQHFATINGITVCTDYYYVYASSISYTVGSGSGDVYYGNVPWIVAPNGTDYAPVDRALSSTYCQGGVCVYYTTVPQMATSSGTLGTSLSTDTVCNFYVKESPIGVYAAPTVGVDPQIPLGFPLAAVPKLYVYNNAPFILSTDEFLQRVLSWSRPYRTVFAKFHVTFCGGEGEVHMVVGYIVTGYSDDVVVAGSQKGARVLSGKISTGWVLVPAGGCTTVYTLDIGSTYDVVIRGAMCQKIAGDVNAMLDSVEATVGDPPKSLTFLLPPSRRVVGHGDVTVREEVLGEAPIPSWASGIGQMCPRSDGRVWPGIQGECYGRAVVGVVAHGHGYVEVT